MELYEKNHTSDLEISEKKNDFERRNSHHLPVTFRHHSRQVKNIFLVVAI